MGGGKMSRLLDGRPLLLHALDPLLGLGLGEIVVVTGFEAETVEAVLPSAVRSVRCPDFGEGMGTSLAAGVRAVRRDAAGILVALGDMPRVPAGHYRALLEASGDLVATRAGQYAGPPAFFTATFRADLEGLRGDRGAKHLFGVTTRFVEAAASSVVDWDEEDSL
jgi:molybdenum cofactor cytidylyltransferase